MRGHVGDQDAVVLVAAQSEFLEGLVPPPQDVARADAEELQDVADLVLGEGLFGVFAVAKWRYPVLAAERT